LITFGAIRWLVTFGPPHYCDGSEFASEPPPGFGVKLGKSFGSIRLGKKV
jgi:hypothetical protein